MFRLHGYRILFLGLMLAILYSAGVGAGPDETQAQFWTDLTELKSGTMGIGKTVISGTEIVDFSVEILAVLPDQSPTDLILVRVSGDAIDKAGGIAAGMSGSPVYVDGKLLGAIGYGFAYTDHRIGLVTPIKDMLPILDLAVAQAGPKPLVTKNRDFTVSGGKIVIEGREFNRVTMVSDVMKAEVLAREEGNLVFVPVRTPVLVNGLGPRALRRLTDELKPFGLVPVPGAGSGKGEMGVLPFEAGSPFGLQMVRGKVEISALGTVTYRDDKGFIGFGHPFMNRGRSNFFATTAMIYTTIPQQEMPFKLGAVGSVVGTLNQDRFAGVGGSLGDYPQVFPLRVTVRDKDLVRRYEAEMEVIEDPVLSVRLAAVAALQSLDTGVDRIGPGTSRVVFRLEADGLPKTIVRDNMFYSSSDISAVSLVEMIEALELVLGNEFQSVDISRIDMDIQLQEKRLTASIEEATPERTEVLPGESLNVEVKIRPYRGQSETKIVRLDIPADVPAGNVRVTVRGGGFGILLPEKTPYHKEGDLTGTEEKPAEDYQTASAKNLEKLVTDFTEREKNNDLVVEFYPFTGYGEVPVTADGGEVEESVDKPGAGAHGPAKDKPGAEKPGPKKDAPTGQQAEGGEPLYEEESPQPVKATLTTGYFIQGMSGFDLNILSPPGSEEAERETGDIGQP